MGAVEWPELLAAQQAIGPTSFLFCPPQPPFRPPPRSQRRIPVAPLYRLYPLPATAVTTHRGSQSNKPSAGFGIGGHHGSGDTIPNPGSGDTIPNPGFAGDRATPFLTPGSPARASLALHAPAAVASDGSKDSSTKVSALVASGGHRITFTLTYVRAASSRRQACPRTVVFRRLVD